MSLKSETTGSRENFVAVVAKYIDQTVQHSSLESPLKTKGDVDTYFTTEERGLIQLDQNGEILSECHPTWEQVPGSLDEHNIVSAIFLLFDPNKKVEIYFDDTYVSLVESEKSLPESESSPEPSNVTNYKVIRDDEHKLNTPEASLLLDILISGLAARGITTLPQNEILVLPHTEQLKAFEELFSKYQTFAQECIENNIPVNFASTGKEASTETYFTREKVFGTFPDIDGYFQRSNGQDSRLISRSYQQEYGAGGNITSELYFSFLDPNNSTEVTTTIKFDKHKIIKFDGRNPIEVTLYRFGDKEKTEIENIIKEVESLFGYIGIVVSPQEIS